MDSPAADILLRPATAADQLSIYNLVLRHRLNPVDLDWRRFTVAQDTTGRLIGCGQIRRHGEVDELASLVVAPDQQGRGVSRLLMQALLAQGRRPLWLVCESHLRALYQRYGFTEARKPEALPLYFRAGYWPLRLTVGPLLAVQGRYVAYMVLQDAAAVRQAQGE